METKETVDANNEKDSEIVEETTQKTEEETLSNDDSQTIEDTNDGGDYEKKESEEKNPYEAKLKELEQATEKNETMMRQKDGALKEEREKRRELEKRLEELENSSKQTKESDKKEPLTADDIDAIFEKKLAKQREVQEIEDVSSDETEKKLIVKLMESGRATTVQDAKVLANAHIIDEHKSMVQEREQEESIMANFSAGKTYGKRVKADFEKDPVLKAAAKGMTAEERKYLK